MADGAVAGGRVVAAARVIRLWVGQDVAARRWATLVGIGKILVHTIQVAEEGDSTKPARPLAGRAEIGDLGRFASRKKLAAYAWLAPRAQDRGEETGATPVGRHVGHQGCRTLKWAFLEAAHGAVRKSAGMAAVFDRRTDGGRRDKNRGYLAVARHLCEIGYACQRKGVDYMEQRPLRPGERASGPATACCEVRPESGQPELAMVRPSRRPRVRGRRESPRPVCK